MPKLAKGVTNECINYALITQHRNKKHQMEGERQTQIQTQSATSGSFALGTVNEEDIMEQFLGTRRGHKTRVGRTLPSKVYQGDPSSSGSRSARFSMTHSDPHVEEYL